MMAVLTAAASGSDEPLGSCLRMVREDRDRPPGSRLAARGAPFLESKIMHHELLFPECAKPHAVAMIIELTRYDGRVPDPRDGERLVAMVRQAIDQGGLVLAHQAADLIVSALHRRVADGQVPGLLESIGCLPTGVCHKVGEREKAVMVSDGYRIADVVAALLHLELMGVPVLAEPATTELSTYLKARRRDGEVIAYAEQEVLWAAKKRASARQEIIRAELAGIPGPIEEAIWQSPSGYTMELTVGGGVVLLTAYSERGARSNRALLDYRRKQLESIAAGHVQVDPGPLF